MHSETYMRLRFRADSRRRNQLAGPQADGPVKAYEAKLDAIDTKLGAFDLILGHFKEIKSHHESHR